MNADPELPEPSLSKLDTDGVRFRTCCDSRLGTTDAPNCVGVFATATGLGFEVPLIALPLVATFLGNPYFATLDAVTGGAVATTTGASVEAEVAFNFGAFVVLSPVRPPVGVARLRLHDDSELIGITSSSSEEWILGLGLDTLYQQPSVDSTSRMLFAAFFPVAAEAPPTPASSPYASAR